MSWWAPEPRKMGPEGVGHRKGWEAQNFALSSLPPQFSFFLLSLGGSSRGILVVFEASGPSNVHVWSSRPSWGRAVQGEGGPGGFEGHLV